MQTSRYYLSQISVDIKFYITSQMIIAGWILKILPKKLKIAFYFQIKKNLRCKKENKWEKNFSKNILTFQEKYTSAYSHPHMVTFLWFTKDNKATSNVLRNIAESIFNDIKYTLLLNIDMRYFKLCFPERCGREIYW